MSNVDLTVDFAGIKLKNPLFTASGTCGYIDELADFFDLSLLGGLVTKSITALPRKGNPGPRIVETDSGMLNAIGLANIGLESFISEKLPIIQKHDLAVFVNVAGWTMDDYLAVIDKLAKSEGICGFELNISCPNVKKGGITFGKDPALIEKITRHAKKCCPDKVLIVKLTPTVSDISETAQAAVQGGADALSLVNTFTAMVVDIEKRKPVLANRTGGLSGPAVKPMAVHLVNEVYEKTAKQNNIPILGGGGIRTASDALEFIIAGASAVTVGTSLFVEPDCPVKIINGLEQYCRRHGITNIKQLTGSLQ